MSDHSNDPYGGPPGGFPPAPGHAGPQGHAQPGYGQPGMGPPQGQPPGYGYGGPPSHQEPTTGWRIAAIVLLIVGPVFSLIGMVPCLGILNWIAIPTNVALAIIGILGMTIGPKAADGRAQDFGLHLAAIITGVLLAIASIARCAFGSGLV